MSTGNQKKHTPYRTKPGFSRAARYRAACALFFFAVLASTGSRAATLVWTGSAGTDWGTAANWSPQQVPGPSDAIQIGFNVYTNQPNISQNNQCASLSFGNRIPVTLTISGSLAVSGGISLAHSGDDFIPHATITGSGTLTCTSLLVGDGVFSKLVLGKTTLFSISLANFTVNGHVTINSMTMFLLSGGVAHNHSRLSLEGGLLTVTGQIRLRNNVPSFLAGHLDGYLPSSGFYIDVSAADARLRLLGDQSLSIAGGAGNNADYYTYAQTQDGSSTVEYAGADQQVSTGATAGLDGSPATYQNLLITGSGTKRTENTSGDIVDAEGYLTVSAGTLDLQVNQAFLTLGGDFTNAVTTRLDKADFHGQHFQNTGSLYTTTERLSFLRSGQSLTDGTADGTAINTAYFKTGAKTIAAGRFIIPPGGNWTVADNATTVQIASNAELVFRSDGCGNAVMTFLAVNQNQVASVPQRRLPAPITRLQSRTAAASALSSAKPLKIASSPARRSPVLPAPPAILTLSLVRGDQVSEPLTLCFAATAKNGYSAQEDQLFLPAGALNAWSSSADHRTLRINSLPYPAGSGAVTLSCSAASGNYSWRVTGVANFPGQYQLSLRDRLTGKTVALQQAGSYLFRIDRANPGSFTNRFVLLINRQDGN
jgi:hypothetical protein